MGCCYSSTPEELAEAQPLIVHLDDSDKRLEGQNLVIEAQKTMSSVSFMRLFKSERVYYENAAHLYEDAAIAYKKKSCYSEAAACYKMSGELKSYRKRSRVSIPDYTQAFQCYKIQHDIEGAISSTERAVEIATACGKYINGAKAAQALAEYLEQEFQSTDAINWYERTAGLYELAEAENSHVYLDLAARLSCSSKQYTEAIELWEQAANMCVSNNIMQYTGRLYLFCSLLCHILIEKSDGAQCSQKLMEYCELIPICKNSRDFEFAESLIKAVWIFKDMQLFNDVVFRYESIKESDSWQTNILIRIKNLCEENCNMTGSVC